MTENDQKRRAKITAVFNDAARSAKIELPREKIEVGPHADHVLMIDVGDTKRVEFSISEDGYIFGPGATLGLGNLDDEGISSLIAKTIVNELSRRSRQVGS